MILNKDSRLTSLFCLHLSQAILDFVILHPLNDLFLTTENIIVDETGNFHFNYFSFVGLEFIKLGKYIPKSDF